MTLFILEHPAGPDKAELVYHDGDTRVVIYTGAEGAAALTVARIAYNRGRRDEAAIRAAAFAGLSNGAPLV